MCAARRNHLDGRIKDALKFLECCLCTADEILSMRFCRVSEDHSAKKNGRISSLAETPSASVWEREERESVKGRRHRCFLSTASYDTSPVRRDRGFDMWKPLQTLHFCTDSTKQPWSITQYLHFTTQSSALKKYFTKNTIGDILDALFYTFWSLTDMFTISLKD